ncbi:MAG: putative protein YbbN [Chloroflexi bacterium]|nr:putative protein YbbN [Chloroflexota bacterium]
MMTTNNIIDVNDSNFDYYVLAYSQKRPVVVEFWAKWNEPSKTLTPFLEQLTAENKGGFRLAKVDVDKNPQLTQRYNIFNIPAVKAFQRGRIISEFNGIQSNQQIREFIHQVVPGPDTLLLEKAQSLLKMEKWSEAEDTSREVLTKRPVQPRAQLILAKSLLGQDQSKEALKILQDFPTSPEYRKAEKLLPLAQTLADFNAAETAPKSKVDAIYYRALRLIGMGNIPAALDGLLEVLRVDKGYQNGRAKQVVLGLFALLGDSHPLTQEYRSELASILF